MDSWLVLVVSGVASKKKDRKWKELKKQIEMLNDVLMDARRFHHHL